jgi:alkanesulfonate monooxygenase SsuD/methylene tetrahydromethanopterin reductase-like flavin-dependent oxidoreductase (luciferase family)
MASIIVAPTEEEVAEKLKAYQALIRVEGSMTHFQLPIDLLAYPREERIHNVLKRENLTTLFSNFFAADETIGQTLDRIGNLNQDFFFVAGTPLQVADEIEKWLDEDGIDGINLRQFLSFETARDFIDLVVPELRKRGRYRLEYEPGETLRERLFGKGQARLPTEHYGARYRTPEVLLAPANPLRF